MFKAVVSILTLGLTVIAVGRVLAMDAVGHIGTTGVHPATLAFFAVALVTVAAVARAYRRPPRLSGGLMTWSLRQHGL